MDARPVPKIPNMWGYLTATFPFWGTFICGIILYFFFSAEPDKDSIYSVFFDPTQFTVWVAIATVINAAFTFQDTQALRRAGVPMHSMAWLWNAPSVACMALTPTIGAGSAVAGGLAALVSAMGYWLIRHFATTKADPDDHSIIGLASVHLAAFMVGGVIVWVLTLDTLYMFLKVAVGWSLWTFFVALVYAGIEYVVAQVRGKRRTT